MLEKEVRRNILRILYEDSMKEDPRDFSSEEFVEMIPGATDSLFFAVYYDRVGN